MAKWTPVGSDSGSSSSRHRAAWVFRRWTGAAFVVSSALLVPELGYPLGLNAGVRGGVIWPSPLVADEVHFPVEGRAGFTGGGFVVLHVTPSLNIEAEVLYAKKSFSSNAFVTDTPVESTWVDVPVTMGLTVGHILRRETEFFVGPQFSFNIEATREFRGIQQDIQNELNDTDVGLIFGGRMSLLADSQRLTIEGRFCWGLVNLDETNWYEIKSRSIDVLVGYRF